MKTGVRCSSMGTDQGAVLLRVYMARHDLSVKELAAKMDLDVMTITRWRRGRSRPDGDMRVKLEQLTDGEIPASAWVRDEAA